MAFAIHWKIKFRVLHSNQLLTVNIWKDGTLPSGYPLTLTGAQAPFSTQEDDNEDLFQPIRTQSGYLRIVDDGTALNSNNASVSFNWKDLLPSTDTDRPVTLTDSSNNILWQGFMQAQNFSGSLYGGTQVREFPVQCCLTVTQGKDINYSQTQIQNFAYLLKQIVDSIPSGFRPQNFIIQGGTDARMWLMKKIDWQNFAALDSDGTLAARFTMYQCLEDMCRFWGWTARTNGDTMYLMCIDDQTEQSLLTLTYAQLGTIAGGTSAGSTDTLSSVTPYGDIYASTEIDDFRNRGANKAVVTADFNADSGELIEVWPASVIKQMTQYGFNGEQYNFHEYTTEQSSVNTELMGATSVNDASFAVEHQRPVGSRTENGYFGVVRLKAMYSTDTPNRVLAKLQTKYCHCFTQGYFSIDGDAYLNSERIDEIDPNYSAEGVGAKHLYISFGIGTGENSALWWDGFNWGNTEKKLYARIGGSKIWFEKIKTYEQDTWMLSPTIPTFIWNATNNGKSGKVYINIYGSADIDSNSTDKTLDLADWVLTFNRCEKNYSVLTKRNTEGDYKASNGNDVREDWNADCIYGSENISEFGFGVVLDDNTTYMTAATYGLNSERPEQHLANRVVNFWATAKRMIRADMWNSDSVVGAITPRHYVTLDGTRLHPFAISHEWRDDVVTMSLLEIPS